MPDGREELVRLLEDEREILRTVYAYAHAIDSADVDGWPALFTDDGVFDVRGEATLHLAGQDELRGFIHARKALGLAPRRHLVIEPMIELDGERAVCTSYLLTVQDEDGAPVVGSFGRYADQLRRCADGRWLIAERVAEVESTFGNLGARLPSPGRAEPG